MQAVTELISGCLAPRLSLRGKERGPSSDPVSPEVFDLIDSVGPLTATASEVVPSALMTVGVLLMTAAAVRGVWTVIWLNSGCFFRMCCTIFV